MPYTIFLQVFFYHFGVIYFEAVPVVERNHSYRGLACVSACLVLIDIQSNATNITDFHLIT